ncbi:hypothetical protein MRB53_024081 [Persea americana]|uniref:Uncharacterized protein n=1 Tax=Persea americana TaxID=3435 RepID=A0ACC2LBR5_PERAE|nr:hypothetical protein MRB53_024081 [Persea americana]
MLKGTPAKLYWASYHGGVKNNALVYDLKNNASCTCPSPLRTERLSTPTGTSALGPAVRQRREKGDVRLATGRRSDLLRQAPRLSLWQSVRNMKTNCVTPLGSSAFALAVLW